MWASCWAAVQYIWRTAAGETTSPLSRPRAPGPGPRLLGVVEVGQQRRRPGPAARPGPRPARPAARTHGETEVANDLPRNGPERHVLPGLDVAGGPVVEQAPRRRRARRSRPPATGSPSGDGAPTTKPDLGLDVQPRATGRTSAPASSRRLALPAGPHDVGAGDHDRAGPAVVADRQVLPVRRQRLAVRAEHPPDVRRVVLASVEVDVVRRPRTAGAARTASARGAGAAAPRRQAASVSHRSARRAPAARPTGPAASSGSSSGPASRPANGSPTARGRGPGVEHLANRRPPRARRAARPAENTPYGRSASPNRVSGAARASSRPGPRPDQVQA